MPNSDIVDIWAKDIDLPDWFVAAMDVPREEAFADVDGHKVHYFRWGKQGSPPLLLTHGFLAHARCWAFIAPFLAQEYEVIAYDLAGMGESELPEDCDGQKRAEDMIGVAEALDLFSGPVKPRLITHSFGSGVALSAMEMAGDRFGRLIICDLMVMRPEKLAEHFNRGGRTSRIIFILTMKPRVAASCCHRHRTHRRLSCSNIWPFTRCVK